MLAMIIPMSRKPRKSYLLKKVKLQILRDVMLLNHLGTRPLDNLTKAIDAVVSEIDRQHPISSVDVEHQDEYDVSALNTFVKGTTDQEAVAGNKVVDGEDDHDANGIDDEVPEDEAS
jgi:hypothetical protein